MTSDQPALSPALALDATEDPDQLTVFDAIAADTHPRGPLCEPEPDEPDWCAYHRAPLAP